MLNCDAPRSLERAKKEAFAEFTFQPRICSASSRLVSQFDPQKLADRKAAAKRKVLLEARCEEKFSPQLNEKSQSLVQSSFKERQTQFLARKIERQAALLEDVPRKRSPPIRVTPMPHAKIDPPIAIGQLFRQSRMFS